MERPRKKQRVISSFSFRPRPFQPFDIDLFPVDMQREIFQWVDFYVFFGITCADRKRHSICEAIKEEFCKRWASAETGTFPNLKRHATFFVESLWPYTKFVNPDADTIAAKIKVGVWELKTYVRGTQEGYWRVYSNGQLTNEAYYVDGFKHGEERAWESGGERRLYDSQRWENGVREGVHYHLYLCGSHDHGWTEKTYFHGEVTHEVSYAADRKSFFVKRQSARIALLRRKRLY